jgi:hypothetical protein
LHRSHSPYLLDAFATTPVHNIMQEENRKLSTLDVNSLILKVNLPMTRITLSDDGGDHQGPCLGLVQCRT